jgi:general secretion pathway protein D
MKTRILLSTCRVGLAAMAVLVIVAPLARPAAETDTETKIRLMAEALRARDAGDLAAAREQALRLLEQVPNDPRALQLLREIEALIAAREEARRNPKPAPMQDVTIPEPASPKPDTPVRIADQADAPAEDIDVTLQTRADAAADEEAKRVSELLAKVPDQRKSARKLASVGRYEEALELLSTATASLPVNPRTKETIDRLAQDRREVEAKRDADTQRKNSRAKPVKTSRLDSDELPSADGTAANASTKEVAQLVNVGRSQYLAGDLALADETFRSAEIIDPENREAKAFRRRIAEDRVATGRRERESTRAQLMEQVTKSWQRPVLAGRAFATEEETAPATLLARKMEEIVLPAVSFTRAEIGQVVAALSTMAEDYDKADPPARGVNIVLVDPANKKPMVSLTLRNVSLRRALDLVCETIGYSYEVQDDAVLLRPAGDASELETRFFPVARATVLRMTTAGATKDSSASPATVGTSREAKDAATGEGAAIRSFLQQAGVNFASVPDAGLAYDGSTLIVTQTARNLRRIRAMLDRYSDVRQVEIEAKFIEVQEGALEELGVNWTLKQKATQHSGAQATYQTSGRSLSNAFGSSNGNQQGRIVRPEGVATNPDGEIVVSEPLDIPIINNAPRIPGSAELASAAGALASVTGIIGEFDVNAVVRALSQQQGTDLLSAPKVTVLSGNPATITVAQEMRYPQSFGQTQSQVGTGNASGGGSAGVAITAGTPQEFTMRNVGVELRVTPTVEEDDYSISLELNPKVTEFDGFVEYGGPSIAISGSTTVTVPSGFYQPIFSVRDISTKVTIWDGATLVMGGLTREEVKKVNDKVPILGDLPLIGRAFRSEGESAQKRNLLIFVTANLVNPNGAPKNFAARQGSGSGFARTDTIAKTVDAE